MKNINKKFKSFFSLVFVAGLSFFLIPGVFTAYATVTDYNSCVSANGNGQAYNCCLAFFDTCPAYTAGTATLPTSSQCYQRDLQGDACCSAFSSSDGVCAAFQSLPTGSSAKSGSGGGQKNDGCIDDSQCVSGLICDPASNSCQPNTHTCINGAYQGTSANCGTTLQTGSRCSQVCALQQALADEGLYSFTIDGEYGSETANAVKKYQQTNNISATGIADPATLSSLNLASGGATPGAGGATGGTPPAAGAAATGGTGAASTAGGCPEGLVSGPGGLCMPQSSFDPKSIAGASTLTGLALTVINYLLILAGMIAVVALVIGGFWYITAAGNEEQSEKGRKAIMNAIIGLIVVVLAYAIVNIIVNTLTTTDILNKAGQ